MNAAGLSRAGQLRPTCLIFFSFSNLLADFFSKLFFQNFFLVVNGVHEQTHPVSGETQRQLIMHLCIATLERKLLIKFGMVQESKNGELLFWGCFQGLLAIEC